MLPRSIRSRLLGLVLATVVPFTALIGGGLWSQWQSDQAAATDRALAEAQLLAAQVDDHIGNLESLLAGLAHAISPNGADTAANDALLRRVKSHLPDYVGNILVFSPDGADIGTSWDGEGERPSGADRSYLRQVLNDRRLSIGDVVRARPSESWVVTIACPIEDPTGRLRAVIAVNILLEHFQDALTVQGFPAGSVVSVVNDKGIVVAQSANGPDLIGRDGSK